VITDLLGSFPWFVPPFAKPEVNLAPQIVAAAQIYRQRVQANHG
jgi:3-methyl-2-oxobutanoate hydroxymethyltransferase